MIENFASSMITSMRHYVGQVSVMKKGRSIRLILNHRHKNISTLNGGTGYGGIRYCKKCKHIDCIHVFEPTITYKVETDEFSGSQYTVSKCKICNKRILREHSGYSYPSKEAYDLVDKIFKEHSVNMTNCGSGYMIELPLHVSRLLRDRGEETARRYIECIISNGEIINFNNIKI